MIPVNVLHGIKPIEVEGEIYALKKGDSAFIPTKLAGAMLKRGWAAKIAKPERLGEVEGAEVRDVSRWVKGISGEQINKLKIGKNGLAISFVDSTHVTAGKVFTPFYSSVNNDPKEAGFSSVRVANIFNTFRRGEKARLWWKEGDNKNLYIKEVSGNLSWRHKLPNIEEAAKMPNLKKVPVAAIKIDISGLKALKKLKADKVAFVYGGNKAAIFILDGYELTYIGEVETNCKSEGIAVYERAHIVKVLKGAKSGFIRVEENRAAKFVVKLGRHSKAVIFVAAIIDEDLRRRIAEEAGIAHKEEAGEDNSAVEEAIEKEAEKLSEELKEEEIINETAPRVYRDLGWDIIKEGIVENSQAPNYKSGVKLEQNGSFYRISVEGCYPRGYTKEEEAVKRYEWLTEVR
jgi:hypothetical protein